MKKHRVLGWEMALLSESYLSLVSERMRKHGLERYFAPFLHIYDHDGQLTQKDLALLLKRDKVSVMRMVDYLSDRDLVERLPNCDDRRCQNLAVTKKGEDMVPKVYHALEEVNRLLFKDFAPEEERIFKNGMTMIMELLNVLPESDFIIKAIKRKK